MFKFLKDAWQDAKQRVEGDQARAAAQAARTTEDVGPTMVSVAQKFADALNAKGARLDFTPASLAIVDRMLARTKEEMHTLSGAEKQSLQNQACLHLGAYLGEVVRREAGGVWIKGEDGLPRIDLYSHVAPVVTVVLGLIHRGHVDMPGGPVETLTAYCNVVSETARAALGQAV